MTDPGLGESTYKNDPRRALIAEYLSEHWEVRNAEFCADGLLVLLDQQPSRLDAEIIKALRADHDVLIIGEDSWSIQHSLACRPNMDACQVHRAVAAAALEWDGPPASPGRYIVTSTDPVQLAPEADRPPGDSDDILVVAIDLSTGEAESQVCVPGDYVLTTAEPAYTANLQRYPTKGTTVLTIKQRAPEEGADQDG